MGKAHFLSQFLLNRLQPRYTPLRSQYPFLEDGVTISRSKHKILPHYHRAVTNLDGRVL